MDTKQIQPPQPRYLSVKNALTEEIRSGDLTPGDKLMSERALQKHFSVSYATVARALKELADAGLIVRKWGKGTFVTDAPQTVMNIAVTFNDIHSPNDPYLLPITNGICQAAAKLNWRSQLYPMPGSQMFSGGSQNLLAALLNEGRIGGVISCDPSPPEDMDRLRSMGCPAVSVLNSYPQSGSSCVIADTASGAEQIIKHLVDQLGHHKLMLVMGGKRNRSARVSRASVRLCEALLDQCRQRGIRFKDSNIVYEGFRWSNVAYAVTERLQGPDRPSAVVCISDSVAMKVVETATQLGLSVPQDLSVVGWGDPIDGLNLSSVRVPYMDMGRQSVNMLNQLLQGEGPTESRAPVKLMARTTTAQAPCS